MTQFSINLNCRFPGGAFYLLAAVLINFGASLTFEIIKNLVILRRHRVFMAFNIVLPVIAFILFYSAIGRPINGLRLAVVNEESSCCEDLLKDLHCIGSGAELLALILGGEAEMFGEDISCHVVKELDPKVFSSIKVMSLEEAEEAVVLAEANAMIRFQEGFSASLAARLRTVLTSESIKESQIDLSTIKVRVTHV